MLEKANAVIFWNFFKAWVRYTVARAFGYEVMATPVVTWHRTRRCERCPFYLDGMCSKCGCLVVSKVLLNTEHCPDGRWTSLWIKKSDKTLR